MVYSTHSRPDPSDANPFTLLCSQTKNPNLCQYTCKNSCPMGLACVDDSYDRIKCPQGTRTGQKLSSGSNKHELLIFLIGALISVVVVICLGTVAVKMCRRRRRRRENERRNQTEQGLSGENTVDSNLFSNAGFDPPSSPKSKKKKEADDEQACFADGSGCLIPVPEEPLSAISLT